MRKHVIATFGIIGLAACGGAAGEDRGTSGDDLSIVCGVACRSFTPRTRGDANGDLKADLLLVGSGVPGTIPTALSSGDGHFNYAASTVTGDTAFPTYSTVGSAHTVLGDFNGDGLADIAVLGGVGASGTWRTIPVAYGQANQRSFAAVNSSGGGNTYLTQLAAEPGMQVVTSDVNGDYFDDLVIVGNGSVVFGLGSAGGGTFTTSIPHAAQAGDYDPSILANLGQHPGAQLLSGDFDGDGLGDVALVGGAGWGSIPVGFSRAGAGIHVTNVASTQFAQWAATPGATAVAGDFDGDKKTDIALVGGSGWTTTPVAFSNGNGSFHITNQPTSWFSAAASGYVWADNPQASHIVRGAWVVAGDFNGDGKSDLALAGGGPGWGSIPVEFSDGNGSFGLRGGAPTNDAVSTFPALAARQDAAVLSASALPSPTADVCGSLLYVTASRDLGGAVNVGFASSVANNARVAASRVPGVPFPNLYTDVFVGQGNHSARLEGLTNGAEYWVQVSPAPLPWSNGVSTCVAVAVDVPANPMGGDHQACFDDGSCTGSLMCVPASATFGNTGPQCLPCGDATQPCCGGSTCVGNNGSGIVGCVGGKDLNICQYTSIPAPPPVAGGGKGSGGGATAGSGCALTCFEICEYSCFELTQKYCSTTDANKAVSQDGACHACCDASCMSPLCTG